MTQFYRGSAFRMASSFFLKKSFDRFPSTIWNLRCCSTEPTTPANSTSKALVPVPQPPPQSELFFDRNFVTYTRVRSDFLLSDSDLKGLRSTTRRSPTEHGPVIRVYWRKDIAAKSLNKWGSFSLLEKEIERRKKDEEAKIQNIFRRVFKKRKKVPVNRDNWPIRNFNSNALKESKGLGGESGRVILTAIAINTANFVAKFGAWAVSGSHALFSEAIHSLADTLNQVILAYGIHKSVDTPTVGHPYGYSNMQYVAALISGTGIFCMGAGLSVYHGFDGLFDPGSIDSISLAAAVLAGSLLSESITLSIAIKSIKKNAAEMKIGFVEYVIAGHDPSVNVVLLEDIAAVLGVLIAGVSMGISVMLNSHVPDAIGSILIGGLLGSVASFMIYTNTNALVGRSISDKKLTVINKMLEGDLMIRQVHDVKGIDMGNGFVRYKAELDIDGRELTKYYLAKLESTDLLFEEAKAIETPEDFEIFILSHGENLVDCLGEQVDRIEREIRSKHPEIRHMDLEVL